MLQNNDISLDDKKVFLKVGLEILRKFRNSIAHGNKAFANSISISLSKNQILTFSNEIINKDNYNHDTVNKNDLLNVIVILGSILREKQKLRFYSELFYLFDEFEGITFTGGKTIYYILGLPENTQKNLRTAITSSLQETPN